MKHHCPRKILSKFSQRLELSKAGQRDCVAAGFPRRKRPQFPRWKIPSWTIKYTKSYTRKTEEKKPILSIYTPSLQTQKATSITHHLAFDYESSCKANNCCCQTLQENSFVEFSFSQPLFVPLVK